MTVAAVRRVLYALLFLSLATGTVPLLVREVRHAAALLPLSHEQRMAKATGSFYGDVMRLRRELPPGEPLALILRATRDIDAAVFFNYYMYPRPTRVYHDLGAYRDDPKRPQIVIGVDSTRQPTVRWARYEELRAEHRGTSFVAGAAEPFLAAGTSIDIPLVASLDGPAPDTYVTEASLQNSGSVTARVTLELLPRGHRVELAIEPGATWKSNDLVYDAFGVMEQGWLRVRSDQPLRSGFWFANRGRRAAEPMRAMTPSLAARLDVPAAGQFYVVNPGDVALMVRIGSEEFLVEEREFITGRAEGRMEFSSDTPFFAFASWRDGEKRSHFVWP